jgi:hypothetical protein
MEYAIRAIDIYGNKSGFSLPCRLSEVFAQDFGPRFLRAEEVSETQTEIRWNTPLDKSITGYQLYMTDGESPSVLVGKFPSEQTSHRVATPKQPYVHYYFIVALDSNGNSSSASEWVAIK